MSGPRLSGERPGASAPRDVSTLFTVYSAPSLTPLSNPPLFNHIARARDMLSCAMARCVSLSNGPPRP
jgi:hypothetical protein